MPGMLVDKRKWDKISGYLDVVVFLILIAGILLAGYGGYLYGYWSDRIAMGFGEQAVYDSQAAALGGIITSAVIILLSLFWIFYRYFKTKGERKSW
ncbi:MAG: hypothetical protein CO114_04575 [Euryarchaeota archaeon CG_4_9_14_3_um_filter_38_12]|nr:MAG: hypothetical protein CO114_04575 [Euryarchaeota archaeon CG_4_9_14_3_um_filter_38_12]